MKPAYLEGQNAQELLSLVLGGDSVEEMLRAISDDMNVLWLAQQSDSVEADEFGLFVLRLQHRIDVAAELVRRTRERVEPSNVIPFTGGPVQ